MPTFPLSGNAILSGNSEVTQSAVLRTEMEGSFTKQSLRYSKQYINRSLTYSVSDIELNLFRTFFNVTINRGVESFDWIDYLDNDTVKDATIIDGVWSLNNIGPNIHRISLVLEVLE